MAVYKHHVKLYEDNTLDPIILDAFIETTELLPPNWITFDGVMYSYSLLDYDDSVIYIQSYGVNLDEK
jgi:hypothetical protein